MQVKNLIHQSMQAIYGLCNSAHHLDVLSFEAVQPDTYSLLLRCPTEALDMLLQVLPTTNAYGETRCQFRVEQVSPLLTMIRNSL